MIPIAIFIGGPTSSNKTKLAKSIQKELPSYIINADSMQVYDKLDILTNKPDSAEILESESKLFSFVEYPNICSVGLWKREVEKLFKINQKIPIVVGGTGLYFKALTEGLVKIPNIPIKVRSKFRKMQKKLGQKKFYKKLINFDPLIKNKIDKNDVQRSIRAYEIKYQTKKSIFDWFKKTKNFFSSDEFIKIYIIIKNHFIFIKKIIVTCFFIYKCKKPITH